MVRVTVMMRVIIRNRFSRFILRLLPVVRENMRMFRRGIVVHPASETTVAWLWSCHATAAAADDDDASADGDVIPPAYRRRPRTAAAACV